MKIFVTMASISNVTILAISGLVLDSRHKTYIFHDDFITLYMRNVKIDAK